MPSEREWKVIYSNQYSLLVEALETEKLAYPETYLGAYHIGEKMRESILETGLFDSLRPIPKFEPPKSK